MAGTDPFAQDHHVNNSPVIDEVLDAEQIEKVTSKAKKSAEIESEGESLE